MSQHRSHFSLSALLLLVACVSVLLAATRSAVWQWPDRIGGFYWLAAGAGFGALLGMCVGFTAHRWFRAGIAGFFIGATTGAVAGAQMHAPPQPLVILAGIVLLLVLGFTMRRRMDQPGVENMESVVTSMQSDYSE